MKHSELKKILGKSTTLFHFTKYDTAIDHILPKMQLLLSSRKGMSDPFEKFDPDIFQSISHLYGDDEIEKRNKDKANKIEKEIEDIFRKAKMVSFCKNNKMQTEDKYGYTRLRMWDQYADNFKGVCLILDKDKLSIKPDLISGNVKYKRIEWFEKEGEITIDYNKLNENYKKHRVELFDKAKKRLFYKHIDYKDESEFRIISFNDNEEKKYIDISKSLLAIMINSEYLKTIRIKCLYDFLKNKNIPLLNLSVKNIFKFKKFSQYVKIQTIDGYFEPEDDSQDTMLVGLKKKEKFTGTDFFAEYVPFIYKKTNH